MADDDEFDQIVKNSQRVLRLNDQYEIILMLKNLQKSVDALLNNASNFCRQMINCMKAWNYLQKTSGLPLSTKIIRQAHGLMMEDEKDVLAGEYVKSPAFAGYHIFVSAGHIERYMEDAIFKILPNQEGRPYHCRCRNFWKQHQYPSI